MNDTERITLRMPKPVHDWLRQQAHETRESINSLIVEALEKQMNQPNGAKENKMFGENAQHGTKVGGSDIRYTFDSGIFYYLKDDPAGGLASINPNELKVHSRGKMRGSNGKELSVVALTWK